jgi:hypothetical protein
MQKILCNYVKMHAYFHGKYDCETVLKFLILIYIQPLKKYPVYENNFTLTTHINNLLHTA